MHIAKNHLFRNFGLLIFAWVVEENEKTQGIKLVFWDTLANLEVEGGRNFGSGICHKTAGFFLPRVVCLCGAIGVLWRVLSSRSCYDIFHTRGIFDQKELEICCFHPSFNPPFLLQFEGNEIWMPGTQGKREVEISGAQGWLATLCAPCGLITVAYSATTRKTGMHGE